PGVPGKWLRASSPAWFVLASLSAVVLASSLLIERPTTPESGGNPSAPRPESPISPEVRDLPDKMAPARRPAGGVEIRRGSTPPKLERPDCQPVPNPDRTVQVYRMVHTDGRVTYTNCPPKPSSPPLIEQPPDCPGPWVHRMIMKDGTVLFV